MQFTYRLLTEITLYFFTILLTEISFTPVAPRMGSDCHTGAQRPAQKISIHAPRMGSDRIASLEIIISSLFQSTLPVWGATRCEWSSSSLNRNFNPRSPYGERPAARQVLHMAGTYFNPRSLYGERRGLGGVFLRITNFNPRSPYGERPGSLVCGTPD